MNPKDFEEHLANLERDIKQPPETAPRRPARIQRMQSRRMQVANRQTPNTIRAMFVPESKYNVTPLLPDGTETTRNVGPSDMSRNDFHPSKSTGAVTVGYSKVTPRKRGGGRGQKVDIDKLMEEYE